MLHTRLFPDCLLEYLYHKGRTAGADMDCLRTVSRPNVQAHARTEWPFKSLRDPAKQFCSHNALR